MKLKENLFKRKKIYKGKFISFSKDIIILPNGKKSIREYAEHPGAVAVVPILEKNNIILVKQYRYPVKKITYEIPAGKLDRKEKPIDCVKRELIEETGYETKKIKKVISYWPAPAFSTEIMHVFIATDLKFVGKNLDEDEFLESEIVPIKIAIDWIKKGKICDSKTIIGLFFAYFKTLRSDFLP